MEVQVEKRTYLVAFHSLPEEECVNLYGFDISDQKEIDMLLRKAYEQIRTQSEELQVSNEELRVQSDELNEANALLHDSITGFRTLAENSPDLIARFDRQNHCLYANPAIMLFYDIPLIATFYGLSAKEFANKNNLEVHIEPEMMKLSEKQRDNVFTTGKPEAMEFHYTSPQGKEYYFDTKIVPEFINGKVVSVLVLSRDITNLKKVETKLNETLDNLEEKVKERTFELEKAYELSLENERRFNEAQRMAHIGSWDRDITTGELYWSDETYRIYGRSPHQFGATYDAFLSYVHPDDRDYVDNSVKEAINGNPYDIDYRIILANGEERVVHAQGGAIFNEENIPVRLRGTVQDITERKKAEEKIKNLANVVESSGDAIMTKSLDGIITSWNKGAEKIYGYSTEEILGKHISILEPDNLKGEIEKFYETIKQGYKTQHYETSRLKKDGTIISVL
jgi:PAS domain S-box-containing protein